MKYQICKRCVMDTTAQEITFDSEGICNFCHLMDIKGRIYKQESQAKKEYLDKIVLDIKRQGIGKKYDCIIGMSGGVDSTFVAYLVKNLGLRPLAVHLDNGWNTEIAVNNIKNALDILGIELFTYVLDWEEFKDIQLSFLKASTPDSEIPTDHAIYALLREIAAKSNIKYIIDGVNYTTETIMPKSWSQGYSDWGYIKLIQNTFGTKKIKSFPHYTFGRLFYYKRIKKQRTFSILNYIDYNKNEAKGIISKELGWIDYGGKHFESYYTKFFQSFILTTKFGFDKRRAHLSTLINSGQISRSEALAELDKSPYKVDHIEEDFNYIAKKFGISCDELKSILNQPTKSYTDYRPNSYLMIENIEELIFSRYNPFSIIIRKLNKFINKR
jgi:N-acetyl sugar amidotransferase